MKIVKNQEKDYGCGLVCVQHAIKELCGIKVEQGELEEIVGTNTEGYTHKELIKILKSFGLKHKIVRGLKNIVSKSSDNKKVYILGWTPYYEHYSILIKVRKNHIYLNEPDYPSYIAIYNLWDFEKSWKDSESDKWCLEVSK